MGCVVQKVSLLTVLKCTCGLIVILGAFYFRLHGQFAGWSNWAVFPVFVILMILGIGLLSWEKPRR